MDQTQPVLHSKNIMYEQLGIRICHWYCVCLCPTDNQDFKQSDSIDIKAPAFSGAGSTGYRYQFLVMLQK
jgi:hypothetical protein